MPVSLPPGISRVGGLTIFAFEASRLGVFGQPIGGNNFIPTSPNDVLALAGADAALDGVQFDNCSGQNLPSGNAASYAASQCGYPDFLLYDQPSGISIPGFHPGDGITISVVGDAATAAQGTQVAQGAQVAVQLWPSLVLDGQNVAWNDGSNATAEYRAALAIMNPQQLAFVIGAMDMMMFAESIRELGATDAGYTDGGGSVSLVTSDHIYGASERRRIPTWLVARSSTVGGSGAAGIALGVAILTGVGVYAATRRSR